jgi:hypothetical protein
LGQHRGYADGAVADAEALGNGRFNRLQVIIIGDDNAAGQSHYEDQAPGQYWSFLYQISPSFLYIDYCAHSLPA